MAGLSEVQPRHDVFREIIRHASLPLLEAAFAAHPPARWLELAAGGQKLAVADAAGNPPVIKRLHSLGFDLSDAGDRMLRASIEADDRDYLQWILDRGYGVGIKAFPIEYLVERCGPGCADGLDSWIRRKVKPAMLGRVMVRALSCEHPKTALYLCLIGVSVRALPQINMRAPTSREAIRRGEIYQRLAEWESSSHARLHLCSLEPDRLVLLGRHRHESFAGLRRSVTDTPPGA